MKPKQEFLGKFRRFKDGWELHFPFPAVPLRRLTRQSWFTKGKTYMAWRDKVHVYLVQMLTVQDRDRGPSEIDIVLYEWNWRADLDNYTKAILDALVGVAINDDRTKWLHKITVAISKDHPVGFKVRVTWLDEPTDIGGGRGKAFDRGDEVRRAREFRRESKARRFERNRRAQILSTRFCKLAGIDDSIRRDLHGRLFEALSADDRRLDVANTLGLPHRVSWLPRDLFEDRRSDGETRTVPRQAGQGSGFARADDEEARRNQSLDRARSDAELDRRRTGRSKRRRRRNQRTRDWLQAAVDEARADSDDDGRDRSSAQG